MTRQIQKRFGEDDDDSFDAGFKIPETKSALNSINETVRAQHQEDMEDLEKAERAGKTEKKKPNNVMCFCGDTSCRIGPFVEVAASNQ